MFNMVMQVLYVSRFVLHSLEIDLKLQRYFSLKIFLELFETVLVSCIKVLENIVIAFMQLKYI